jgi:ribosome maturation factor RimP
VNTPRPVGQNSAVGPAAPVISLSQAPSQSPSQRLFDELSPILAAEQYELVDVEHENAVGGAVLRILLDRSAEHPLGRRIDLEGVAEATRFIDAYFEEHDPLPDAFTLEVSSPGLERPLRTPAHFGNYLDAEVAIKTVPGTAGERRIQGFLIAADTDVEGVITVKTVNGERQIPYAALEKARTVFRWGEEESPLATGAPRKKGALPKGQRPIHPKAAAKAAEQSAVDNPNGALTSSSPTGTSPDSSPDSPESISPKPNPRKVIS